MSDLFSQTDITAYTEVTPENKKEFICSQHLRPWQFIPVC